MPSHTPAPPALAAAQPLRHAFKLFNRGMLLLWRLGLGRWLNSWPAVGGRILVLVHRGRRSGRIYRTPVNYAEVGGHLYVTAGFGRVSDWYRNVRAHPAVEIWLPDGWWLGSAEDVSDDPARLVWLRQVLIASGFAAYAAGLNPATMSDAALAHATADYRLLRLRRTAPRTGPGGPGDLAWVWPIATVLLGWLAWRRPRRRA